MGYTWERLFCTRGWKGSLSNMREGLQPIFTAQSWQQDKAFKAKYYFLCYDKMSRLRFLYEINVIWEHWKGIPKLIFLVSNSIYLSLLVWDRGWTALEVPLPHRDHPRPPRCPRGTSSQNWKESNRPKYFKEQRMILVTDTGFSEWLWLTKNSCVSQQNLRLGRAEGHQGFPTVWNHIKRKRILPRQSETHSRQSERPSFSCGSWLNPFSLRELQSETLATLKNPWASRNG